MSKSILIKIEEISKDVFKELVSTFYVKEMSPNEYLLKLKGKDCPYFRHK